MGEFSLDGLQNCIPSECSLLRQTYSRKCSHKYQVEIRWHGSLDEDGSFCITPTLVQISKIITKLVESNLEWDMRVKSDPQAPHGLDVRLAVCSLHNLRPNFSQLMEPPFVLQECLLLVFRPKLFLPNNRPLLIDINHAFQVPGGQLPPPSKTPQWTAYSLEPYTPFFVNSSGTPWFNFEFKSLRPKEDYPSIFSFLIHANSKLQSIEERSGNYWILDSFITNIEAAIAAIFHIPRQVPSQALHLTPPASQQAHHSDFNINEPDLDMESEDDDTESKDDNPKSKDDNPKTINGLTFPKMHLVMRRALDGRISAQD